MSYWETGGKFNDWRTPAYIFEALGCGFDMDVAGSPGSHVPADAFIDRDSLDRKWSGFIWMNPPFGGRNGIEPWLTKFFLHGNGIALTPDRTSAPWFRKAWTCADMVLFMPKVRFLKPDGSEGKSPSNGTALFASGPHAQAALLRASYAGLGIAALPLTPKVNHAGAVQ